MTPLPTVSIVCPSYNRHQFLPFVVKFFRWQNYPRDRLELLILDDSQTSAHSFFKGETSVRYLHSEKRIDLGAKRNQLNKLAGGDIIVCFDDDDFYGPDRVRFAVNALRGSGAEFGGTADVLYYFPKLDRFVRFNHHICASSMFYTRDYGRSHAFIEGRGKAEEGPFRKTKNIAVLANDKSNVAIGHGTNTVSKRVVAQLPAQPYKADELFPPDYLAFLKTL